MVSVSLLCNFVLNVQICTDTAEHTDREIAGLIPRNFLGTAFPKGIVGIGGVRTFMKQPRDAKSKQLAAMFSVTGAVALSFAALYMSRVWQHMG